MNQDGKVCQTIVNNVKIIFHLLLSIICIEPSVKNEIYKYEEICRYEELSRLSGIPE